MIQLKPMSLEENVTDDNTSTNNRKQKKKLGAKEMYWRSIIDDWITSGLTKKIFCEQRNVSFSALSYWRNRLSRKSSDPNKKNFTKKMNDKQNQKNTVSKTALPFSQLKVTLPSEPICPSSPYIEIVTPCEYTVKLPVSINITLLREVLTTLGVCYAEGV